MKLKKQYKNSKNCSINSYEKENETIFYLDYGSKRWTVNIYDRTIYINTESINKKEELDFFINSLIDLQKNIKF